MSWIPGDHSMRARLSGVLPGDVQTMPQLMANVKYASMDSESEHGTGGATDPGTDKKQLSMRASRIMGDWLKDHPGATKQDFLDALANGSIPPSNAGGLNSGQQQDLAGMIEQEPDLLDTAGGSGV